MLLRTDPFGELDRMAAHLFGASARPAVMPMDAWREGEHFIVECDLPAVDLDSVAGVLRLTIPVTEKAEPRRIAIDARQRHGANGGQHQINA